jgi:hypothetical protein
MLRVAQLEQMKRSRRRFGYRRAGRSQGGPAVPDARPILDPGRTR